MSGGIGARRYKVARPSIRCVLQKCSATLLVGEYGLGSLRCGPPVVTVTMVARVLRGFFAPVRASCHGLDETRA